MAWSKASLKIVFLTDETNDNGDFIKKSKTFSNLKEGASEEACLNVARAVENVQVHSLFGLTKVDYTEIEVY